MPFDRAFYAGGTNGIRGWSIRDLGPGFASEDISGGGIVNGVGDLQIEFSTEYRRHLTDAFELACFTDAGNVWILDGSHSSELQALNWKSVALGTGLGVRLDFDFFLLRLDGAFRVHDPSRPSSERWIDLKAPKGQVHLGIGHSF